MCKSCTTYNREMLQNKNKEDEVMYESKCPNCGNVDKLTKAETKRTVHCQGCYNHYENLENDFLKGYTVVE